jgi:hypothetical protein
VSAKSRARRYLQERGWRPQQGAYQWRQPGDPAFYTLDEALAVQAASELCGTIDVTLEDEPSGRSPDNRPPDTPVTHGGTGASE